MKWVPHNRDSFPCQTRTWGAWGAFGVAGPGISAFTPTKAGWGKECHLAVGNVINPPSPHPQASLHDLHTPQPQASGQS